MSTLDFLICQVVPYQNQQSNIHLMHTETLMPIVRVVCQSQEDSSRRPVATSWRWRHHSYGRGARPRRYLRLSADNAAARQLGRQCMLSPHPTSQADPTAPWTRSNCYSCFGVRTQQAGLLQCDTGRFAKINYSTTATCTECRGKTDCMLWR